MDYLFLNGAVSSEKVSALANLIRATNLKQANLILNSNGGYISAAYKIVDLLWHYTQNRSFDVYVLDKAKSAATFICLGANKLHLSDIAELGPIDPQIPQEKQGGTVELFPVISHNNAAKTCIDIATDALDKMIVLLMERTHNLPLNTMLSHAISYTTQLTKPLFEQIEPHRLAQYQSFIYEVRHYASLIQNQGNLNNVVDKAEHLLFRYPSHNFVINAQEIKNMGFNSEYITNSKFELLQKELEKFNKEEGIFKLSIKENN